MRVVIDALAAVLTAPLWLLAAVEKSWFPESEVLFTIGAQAVATAPGLPGMLLRRAYYRWALERCSSRCVIGYGAIFTHRSATVGPHVYVGPYALIGRAHLRDGSLIGSRASLISGGPHHHPLPDGTWGTAAPGVMNPISIGPNAWIGEGALVMADVLPGAMVTAGAVVASVVAANVVVGGNPARFVKRVREAEIGET